MKTAMTAESTLYDAQTIRERVRAAGVVGAGGAGFPAHVKLQAQVDTFLVNAAECEPMLKVDQQLMAVQAERLIRGVQYAMTATGARAGIIALKEKYQKAINALTPLLPAGIRLHILPDVYPAGDEVLTIWMATGGEFRLPRCRSASAWWSITSRLYSTSPEPLSSSIRLRAVP